MQTHDLSGQRIPQVSAEFPPCKCSKGEGAPCSESVLPSNWAQGGWWLGQGHPVSQPSAETGVQVSCSPLGILLARVASLAIGESPAEAGPILQAQLGAGGPQAAPGTSVGFLQRMAEAGTGAAGLPPANRWLLSPRQGLALTAPPGECPGCRRSMHTHRC